jgi:hypothetical protein
MSLPLASPLLADGTAAHSTSLTSGGISIVIGLLVLAWILYGQVRRKPLTAKSRLGLILAVVGLVETWNFAQHTHLTTKDVSLIVVSIAIGLGLATLRARTVRIWSEGGTAWQQGTWVTALLWIVGLGQHLLVDFYVAKGLGDASLLLYFGIVIFAQRMVVIGRARAQGLLPSGSAGLR